MAASSYAGRTKTPRRRSRLRRPRVPAECEAASISGPAASVPRWRLSSCFNIAALPVKPHKTAWVICRLPDQLPSRSPPGWMEQTGFIFPLILLPPHLIFKFHFINFIFFLHDCFWIKDKRFAQLFSTWTESPRVFSRSQATAGLVSRTPAKNAAV